MVFDESSLERRLHDSCIQSDSAEISATVTEVSSDITFPLFPKLLPEIRSKIWALPFPGPRVLLVQQSSIVPHNSRTTGSSSLHKNFPEKSAEYTTSPISYGGKHPAILSVCKESRAEALRYLTSKFDAFWNFDKDTIYSKAKRWGADDAMKMLSDMRKRGLLDCFKNLALDSDIWQASTPEHWDALQPGIAWRLQSAEFSEQSEFKPHDSWCRVVQGFQKKMVEYVEHDLKKKEEAWKARPPGPNIEMRVIEGRMMEALPFSTRMYEPPGVDFFG